MVLRTPGQRKKPPGKHHRFFQTIMTVMTLLLMSCMVATIISERPLCGKILGADACHATPGCVYAVLEEVPEGVPAPDVGAQRRRLRNRCVNEDFDSGRRHARPTKSLLEDRAEPDL